MRKLLCVTGVLSLGISPSLAGGLLLSGNGQYATAGRAAGLGSVQFTIECWFKRLGPGVSSTTGTGGVTFIPLVTKGRNEAEGSTADCNFVLGIRPSDGVLVADFEDRSFGFNHPIAGITPVPSGSWQHAAATYDGTRWRLYLNGALENTEVEGAAPRNDSVQHFGIGSALNSTGAPEGYFAGEMDEVRVWGVARSQAQIQADLNREVISGGGLLGRWGFEEGSGTTAFDATPAHNNLTLIGSAQWTAGAPLIGNQAPSLPTLVGPTDDGDSGSQNAALAVIANDADSTPLTVTYYGRMLPPGGGEPFSLVALPDTQFYSESAPQTFVAQTQWIVDQREARNIRYVASLGDIVNQSGSIQQWINAKSAFSVLDAVPELPYGLTVGNHDQFPCCSGVADGSGTENFNAFFPYTLYEGVVPWYGGHYGNNNDNSYLTFSASGMDFVVVHIEWNTTANTGVLNWAENVFRSHPNHHGILVTHYLIGTGEPGSWGTQGQITYNALRDVPNLFLMMCGHISGEGRREDLFQGDSIYTLLADYQSRTNYGDGWLRILNFRPADNEIDVITYSVTLDRFETDVDSQFTLSYYMGGSAFANLGARVVNTGETASLPWNNLIVGRSYEWYTTVSDGQRTTISPHWTFSVVPSIPGDVDGDGDVDLSDLSQLLASFGACTGNATYSVAADLNGSGCIDLADLSMLLANFGQ